MELVFSLYQAFVLHCPILCVKDSRTSFTYVNQNCFSFPWSVFSQLTLLRQFLVYCPSFMNREWQRPSLILKGMDTLLLLLARMAGEYIFVLATLFFFYKQTFCTLISSTNTGICRKARIFVVSLLCYVGLCTFGHRKLVPNQNLIVQIYSTVM